MTKLIHVMITYLTSPQRGNSKITTPVKRIKTYFKHFTDYSTPLIHLKPLKDSNHLTTKSHPLNHFAKQSHQILTDYISSEPTRPSSLATKLHIHKILITNINKTTQEKTEEMTCRSKTEARKQEK